MVRRDSGIVLVDTGIGLHDIADPASRIGREAIDAAGFQFIPAVTAANQLSALGISIADVTDIVMTHCDPDHAGGLSDFPHAKIHLSIEEQRNLESGNQRYSQSQFSHDPHFVTYQDDDCETLGLPSRRVQTASNADIRLIPLFGHTNGHCGVAVRVNDNWSLHVGDAYYLRDELTTENHPIDELATLRSDNNDSRLESLNRLRKLTQRTDVNLTYFGYHDVNELPADVPRLHDVA